MKLLEGLAASMDAIDERVDLAMDHLIEQWGVIARLAGQVGFEKTRTEALNAAERLRELR